MTSEHFLAVYRGWQPHYSGLVLLGFLAHAVLMSLIILMPKWGKKY